MKNIIIPSIIAKSQKELDKRISKVSKHTKVFHLDVMDGKFVKNKSLMFDFKLPRKGFRYEAHLMMEDPEDWIKKHWKKIHTIIVYPESFDTEEKFRDAIKFIKSKKRKTGMAINPGTSVLRVGYINLVSLILKMTVNPGKYGATFLPKQLRRIKNMRKFRPKKQIEVDGGMNPRTIKLAKKAGANRFVVGSYLQKSKDVGKAVKELKRLIRD